MTKFTLKLRNNLIRINSTKSLLFLTTILLLNCNKNPLPNTDKMIYIPPGNFIIGSEDEDTYALSKEFGAREKFFENEKPSRKIYLEGFYIDKYEVINKNYNLFTTKTKLPPPPHWINGSYKEGRDNHPVRNVSWMDANSYCKWAGKRLPKEEEWEKAIRGPNGNQYPWGNTFNVNNANLNKGDTVSVGSMAGDKSYYNVYDMAGNLKEWTSSWYRPYPGSTMKSEYFGTKYKVIRGTAGNIVGHYNLPKIFSRASYRSFFPLNGKAEDIGFRCVKN